MKITFRLISLTTALCIILFFGLSVFGNEKTYVSAFSKIEKIGSTIFFSEEDFVNCVTGNDKISEIQIFSLPVYGELQLDGRVVTESEYIAAEDFDHLSYCSYKEEYVEDKIGIIPILEKSGTHNDSIYISVYLSNKLNYSPIAINGSFKTYSNVKLKGTLTSVDTDEDQCSFEIVKKPKKGKVIIEKDNFIYEPYDDKIGKDSFEFRVIDSKGNTSNIAKINIDIIKSSDKATFSYCDMNENEAHFEALYLREQGIMAGETFGEENFFYPNEDVTRAQFIALVASVVDMAIPTVSVGTGLSDNEDIPDWAKSYVAAAINCGVIYGESNTDGNKTFRANDYITRAEAASILNRAVGLADENRTLTCSDKESVPAWAEQSLVNTTAAGIIDLYDDNTLKANNKVTREEVAKMLYQSLNYLEKQKESKSFWEKLFD